MKLVTREGYVYDNIKNTVQDKQVYKFQTDSHTYYIPYSNISYIQL